MSGAIALGALAILFLCGAFCLARMIANAPLGYETDDGFHFGVPELPDAGRDGNDFATIYDPGRQLPERADFVAPFNPFHADPDSPEAQAKHA